MQQFAYDTWVSQRLQTYQCVSVGQQSVSGRFAIPYWSGKQQKSGPYRWTCASHEHICLFSIRLVFHMLLL